jgi:hypothetical protein
VTNVKKINDTYLSVPEEVKLELAKMGIQLDMSEEDKPHFRGDKYCGVPPKNLDELDTSELAELMSAHISWTRYINGALSDAVVQLRCREDALSAIKQSIIKSKGKDCVEFDDDYLIANYNVLWWSAMKSYLESAETMCAQNYKVISRIVTLRGQDQEQNIRLNSVKSGTTDESRTNKRKPRPWLTDNND